MTRHARPQELVAAAIDFELTPAEGDEVADHLATCSTCRATKAGYRSDASTLREIAFVDPPASVRSAVLGAAARAPVRVIRPWRLVAAAALLLALVAGATAAIGALTTRPSLVITVPTPAPTATSTARTSSVPTAAPSTVPSVTPSIPPLADVSIPLRWTRVADQPSLADAGMSAVAVGPDRYVAVGCATTAKTVDISSCTGASWTSTDGQTWVRGTVPQADGLYLSGVAASPIGYLAWAFEPGVGTGFWASPDGATWTRAPGIASFFASEPDGYVTPSGAVWFDDRYIAFGDYGFWTSPDGLAWSDGLQVEAGCGTPMDPARAQALTPPGGLVVFRGELLAWGVDWFADTVGDRPSIARSADAACWSRSDGPSGGEAIAMSATDRGLAAVGFVPATEAGVNPPALAWGSSDGLTWTTSTFVPGSPQPGFEMMTAGDRGVYASGSTSDGPAVGWRSADGVAWTPDPAIPPDFKMSIAPTADGFIAVGRDENGRNVVATVFLAR